MLIERIESSKTWSNESKVELITGNAAGVLFKDWEASHSFEFTEHICKQIFEDMGWFLNKIHISRSIDLEACCCQIRIDGCIVSEARFLPNLYLAVLSKREEVPPLGLDAGIIFENFNCVWLEQKFLYKVIKRGTILTPANALFSWLKTSLTQKLHELFGFEDLQNIIDLATKTCPETVTEALKTVTKPLLLQVFRNLLEEGVTLQPLENIFCSIALHTKEDCTSEYLTTIVRQNLSQHICAKLADEYDFLNVILLSSELESKFLQLNMENAGINKNNVCEDFISSVAAYLKQNRKYCQYPVLLVHDNIRSLLSKALRKKISDLHILSYSEIPAKRCLETIHTFSTCCSNQATDSTS